VPLRTRLNNGDQVEIATSKTQTPSPTWEQFVVTGKAKARIRRFIRLKKRAEFSELGKAILQKAFRQEGYTFSDKAFDGVLQTFDAETAEDIYAAVGEGIRSEREVLHAIFPGLRQKSQDPGKVVPIARSRAAKDRRSEHRVPIRGLIAGMAVHFARCCHPLPGDRIVGIVTTGKGVTIHTIDCETLEQFNDTPERWLDVGWDVGDNDPERHVGRLSVTLTNEPGSLGSLTTIIGKNQGNITNLKFTNRSPDFFDMLIDIEVANVRHLTNIVAALRAAPVINSVERARG
jgi:GTP diphosphokinase / guanosine-3',5'-bis(diphosphate) 3'-diphosphatase